MTKPMLAHKFDDSRVEQLKEIKQKPYVVRDFFSRNEIDYINSQKESGIDVKKRGDVNNWKYDKNKDFFINSIPFDHKSTVLPKKYNNTFEINDENEQELLTWLYMNQSQQGRKHLKNRLFLVFYDKNTNDHWKLKAELTLIDKVVDEYLSSFDELKLTKLEIDNNDIVTDLIWVQPNLLS